MPFAPNRDAPAKVTTNISRNVPDVLYGCNTMFYVLALLGKVSNFHTIGVF